MAERVLLQRSYECRSCLRCCLPGMLDQGGCMIRVRNVAGRLEAVRQWFNDKSAFARLIAIQSST
jgi:hypothetical protein